MHAQHRQIAHDQTLQEAGAIVSCLSWSNFGVAVENMAEMMTMQQVSCSLDLSSELLLGAVLQIQRRRCARILSRQLHLKIALLPCKLCRAKHLPVTAQGNDARIQTHYKETSDKRYIVLDSRMAADAWLETSHTSFFKRPHLATQASMQALTSHEPEGSHISGESSTK